MAISTKSTEECVRTSDLLKELLAREGKCLVLDEAHDEFITQSQAEYWRQRGDIDAYCRVVLGYQFTPATRCFGLTTRIV